MSRPMAHDAEEPIRRLFFLNYARPRVDEATFVPSHWVRQVFDDLVTKIHELTGLDRAHIGFADVALPPGTDRQQEIRAALASADVLVALYSEQYLTSREANSERATFHRRLAKADSPAVAQAHILHVLWAPPPGIDDFRVDLSRARHLAEDIPEYVANGLSVLCRLATFREQYTQVLERLAREIIRIAGDSPVALATAVDLVEPQRVWAWPTAPFTVAVLAPTSGELPGPNGRGSGAGYGPRAEHWQPFEGMNPVADAVAAEAARIRLPVDIIGYVTDDTLFSDFPGIILVDPWSLATDNGRRQVQWMQQWMGRHEYSWVTVAAVADEHDPQFEPHGARYLGELERRLRGTRRFVRFTTVADWRSDMPEVVNRMRREYMKDGPSYAPAGPPGRRPRLGRLGPHPPDNGSAR
ncbi:TIR domain-containing protein [Dactylosporangium sp. CA-092794]|uniref:TIR domain-containing protein n=1 Tax=Dactylosporangium sp. CA-092794 TaxID=3239929 RepID=UPI003D8DCEF6